MKLEKENFKINSKGWKIVDGVKQNKEGDVWEIIDGEFKGEQYFNWDAAMRETKKAGKRMPTKQEFDDIDLGEYDIPLAGYRLATGAFGFRASNAYLWSSSPASSSTAWYRNLNSTYSTVNRYTYSKAVGFSVRCLKNCEDELKKENFKINSKGWKIVDGVKQNKEGDVWEIIDGEFKGEQYFNWDAAMRETKKAGKRMPTNEEFDDIDLSEYNLPLAGYRAPTGAFGGRATNALLWSSSPASSSSAWYRLLSSTYSSVNRLTFSKADGFSVRCLKNCEDELKKENFKINSKGWKIVDGVKQNKEGDVWEIIDGEFKGEQYFNWDAAMRETKKAGERMPTKQEFDDIDLGEYDIPLAGYRYTAGAFYARATYANLWSSSPASSSAAWNRALNSTNSSVYREANSKANGFSVRCLKNCENEREGLLTEQFFEKGYMPQETLKDWVKKWKVKDIVSKAVQEGMIFQAGASNPDELKKIKSILLKELNSRITRTNPLSK